MFLTDGLFFCLLLGSRCLGVRMGDLDGWDGDYSVYLLPTGTYLPSEYYKVISYIPFLISYYSFPLIFFYLRPEVFR